jgi:hypothetical protein
MKRDIMAVIVYEGRNNSKAKKEEIIARLLSAWERMPEQRLGQLIMNSVGRDPFYCEDYELIEKIERFLNEQESKVDSK